MTTKTDEQERKAFEAWAKKTKRRGNFSLREGEGYADGYADTDWHVWQARAALQSQDREDALIEIILEACDEWSGYVEVDNAPRTLREHIKLAIDHARRIEGEGKS